MKKMKTRILLLLAVLMVSAVGAKADNVLYAEVSGTTVTIKCCEYTALPAGAIYFNTSDSWNESFRGTVTTAVIDESCQNFDGTSLTNLFRSCELLETITGLENLNTSSVVRMDKMFLDCAKLTSLDLSSFDTSSVKNMESMFNGCKLLSSVNVGSWNTAKVENMQVMFNDCGALTSLDLSGWNTAKVTNMFSMFNNCSQLKSVYVSDDWSTASVTSSNYMFDNCSAIVGEDGTTYNSSNITADYAHFGTGGYLRNNYLYDTASNSSHLSAWHGKKFGAVKISGRTLKAGHWNTLCLPFALDADQIAASFPAGTVVRTLDSYSNDGTTVTIGFADAATMEVGKAYIVHIPEGEDIVNPVFKDVTISYIINVVSTEGATFRAVFNKYDTGGASRYILFLQNDKFYYPTEKVTVNPFRGYIVTSAEVPETAASANIIIDWGDGETTGIANTDFADETDGVWYTLQGVKLDGKPTEKGIYIINGKKVAVQ